MALQKTYNYKGVTANYWRAINIVNNYNQGQTRATIALYANEDVRQESEDNILLPPYIVFLNGIYEGREAVYTALKAAETELDTWTEDENPVRILFFSDAEDV